MPGHPARRQPRAHRWSVRVVTVASVVALGLTACSSSTTVSGTGDASPDPAAPACPVESLDVVVSVDQWRDLVRTLSGSCAKVTTVVTGSAADPHDFEPTPADSVAITSADLAMVNGAGYDAWALDAVAAADPAPAVVDAAAVMGVADGANPHLWYSPDAIDKVGAAVTAALIELRPDARTYFEDRTTDWVEALRPWHEALDVAKTASGDRSYGATETVFDLQAGWLGLSNATPTGFVTSSLNETDPSPGDLASFGRLLSSGQVAVLVVNSQTESAVTDELRRSATSGRVPVVEITETLPPGVTSFVNWQVAQLRALREALTQ